METIPEKLPEENFFIEDLRKNLEILYFSENSRNRWEAQKWLNEFQNIPNAWKINFYIYNSNNLHLIYFGLNLLDQLVSFSWENVPQEEKTQIQNFLTNWIYQLASDFNIFKQNTTTLRKLNLIVVKIFCQAEKKTFFFFLFDLINSAKKTETICENNLNIIYCLFEELFSNLNFEKTKICYQNDFQFEESLSEIKYLCFFVLDQFDFFGFSNLPLISLALKTFKKILEISPKGFLIEEFFLIKLIFLSFKTNLGNISLKCLIEWIEKKIFFTKSSFSEILEKFIIQFQEFFPLFLDWTVLFSNSTSENREFIFNCANFFLGFLRNNLLIEKKNFPEKGNFLILCRIMLKISCLPDFRIFKVCLDWWEIILRITENHKYFDIFDDRFNSFFYDLKVILIGRMPKPEEVLIREDDYGEIIRESTEETETKNVHIKAKNILAKLTKIDPSSTRSIILEKMTNQINDLFWNRNILNTLCWSVGSISNILTREIENHFLVAIIKDLLFLCEIKKGKENKAVIASNIMYVVGQFPRFLRTHWKFLKAVIFKLFEFMHETFPGVKDMACDTFLKIGINCSQNIIEIQEQEKSSLLEQILNSLKEITQFLEFRQIKEFYKTLGTIISNVENDQKRNSYLSKIFQLFYHNWVNNLKKRILLKDIESITETTNHLKINIEIGKILKKKYYLQIKTLFKETFFLYNWVSKTFEEYFSIEGEKIFFSKNFHLLKILRCVIIEIVFLYTKNCILDETSLFKNENLKILIQPICLDYRNSFNPLIREVQVINFCFQLLSLPKIDPDVELISIIFNLIFKPTLEMIKPNFEDYPDIRKAFFSLLEKLIRNFFFFIFKLEKDPIQSEISFELIIHSIIWGIKHPDTTICNQNLEICFFLLNSIEKENFGNYFYNKFFKQMLNDLISVITDKLHISSLEIQCKVLSLLLRNSKKLIDQNYLNAYLKLLFSKVFPYAQENYIENLIIFCFMENNEKNIKKEFKKLLKTTNFYVSESDSE